MNQMSLTEAVFAVRDEYEVVVADEPSLIRQSFRLRHQVYCVERGFLDGIGDLEYDEYDSHSRHVVLISREIGQIVGTVRMVLPSSDEPDNSFPLQAVCRPRLLGDIPIESTVEISRFAISKERRSGLSTGLMRLGLVQGLVRLSHELGMTHWCAVMERPLLRLLQSNSIHFQALGPLVDYHGPRQPCFSELGALLDRVGNEQPDVWDYLTQNGRFCSTEPSSRSLAA
jgi:N-acyl-L-homoserine lactone synthetase